ncbi:MAG TPA: accessory gene regulator B family protein [Clostridium sp.]
MITIQSTSNYCARYLSTKVSNEIYPSVEDQIEVFEYGFMVIIGALVKGILLVSLASILGVLVPVIAITFTFSSLRIIAGGYHLKNFLGCMVISLTQFIISSIIVQYTQKYWTYINIYSLFIFSIIVAIYIIIRYVPRDTPNKPITDQKQKVKFKKWSSIYLTTWTMLMTIFLLLHIKIIVIASCFGLLLELLSISTLGQKMYTFVD